ncbi:AsmA family protein [Microvirga thermotolerans]|uniref:AsmA family protein n=1 Tax=Microvirga thermotolerans TaxID=2651334 RepID=A0A5P9JX66_9HYPH|nr:AsmA family protein [Microvirga thermotolerans]QFU16010.1 AsmA family protein [Microvirga thermotolerans]
MRDILTIIASIVILILAVAVAAPPFVDWEAHRSSIDRLISRASGTEAHTEGRIGVRILPSPRLRFDRLRLGGKTPDSPSLTADLVWAEIALTPLLRGEVRFTETRIGRADIRIPVAPDGSWRVPQDLTAGSARGREFAIDSLKVAQLLVTTQTPTTGRTDQAYAENVSIEGQKLVGPWRVEGSTAGVPFRLVTGELTPDRTVQLRLSGGGDVYPRFDVEAKLALDGESASPPVPILAGKAKILFGPPAQVAAAGIPIPIVIETEFKAHEGAVDLSPFTLEAGEGGASLRMAGEGSIGLNDPRIRLKLEGRRLDADSFILSSSGQDFTSRLGEWSLPRVSVPLDLDLKIDSIGLAQEDLSNAILRLTLDKGEARIERIDLLAPGDTRIAMEGTVGLTTKGGADGKVALASGQSDRFARYLERLGLRSPFLKALDGRPLEMSSDVAYSNPVMSLSRMRVKAGEAVLTGNLRYTAPEGDGRGKLEAQVAIQNLNLDQLPRVSSVFEATQNLDVGFILDARNVRAGTRPEAGRITARILSDGPALLVESLDIVNLAGANARVSGRIAPDGSGRIAGKVTAQRAAPLVDLLGSVWIGGISKLVPYFLREGDLDLDIVTERVAPPPNSTELRLRTTAKGTAAGGSFLGSVDSLDGRTENLDVTLGTDNTGRWVNRATVPSLNRPSQVILRGTRVSSGRFNVTVSGDVGGVKVTTRRPFALSADDDVIDSGEAEIATADIAPFLLLLGDGSGVASPVPAQGRITLGRERDASLLSVTGQIANGNVQARLAVRSRSDITGDVSLDRLSLPWLVTTLALNTPPGPDANAIWSTARFGQSARLVTGGQVAFKVANLDLGRGIQATRAGFAVEATPDGAALRNFDAALGSGRLTGSATVTRQGALASVVGEGAIADVPLSALAGPTPFEARLTGSLKFGSAADSMAGLVANLGGAGEWRVADLRLPDTDPSAFERALKRLLADADPLAEGKAEAVLGMELARAALAAPTVSTSAALVSGSLRLSPFVVQNAAASWQGAVTYDLKSLALEARGTLAAKAAPQGWVGAPPSVGLAWRGSLAAPVREIDAGPFRNGLAAIVLKRELEKIEAFEKAQAERQRQIQAQQEAERRAKAAAEEAARQAKAREEADRARIEAERIQSQQRNDPNAALPPPDGPTAAPFTMPPLTPPLEIAPPPAINVRPGG